MEKERTTITKGRFKTFDEAKAYTPYGKNVGVRERVLRNGTVYFSSIIEITISNRVNLSNSEVGLG